MENLWKRLKPAVKKQILAEEDQYPFLVGGIKTELKSKSYWSDLPIGTARNVVSFTHYNIYELNYNDLMWGDKFVKKA